LVPPYDVGRPLRRRLNVCTDMPRYRPTCVLYRWSHTRGVGAKWFYYLFISVRFYHVPLAPTSSSSDQLFGSVRFRLFQTWPCVKKNINFHDNNYYNRHVGTMDIMTCWRVSRSRTCIIILTVRTFPPPFFTTGRRWDCGRVSSKQFLGPITIILYWYYVSILFLNRMPTQLSTYRPRSSTLRLHCPYRFLCARLSDYIYN